MTLFNQGIELMETGSPERALEVMRAAEKLQPLDLEIQKNLSTALNTTGHPEEAELHARRAMAMAPDRPAGYIALGEIYGERGDDLRALPLFQRALALDPDSTQALFDIAAAHENMGRVQEACNAWQQLARSQSRAVSAREGLQRLHCVQAGPVR